MSNGVIDGLKEVGAKRVAVATAYNDVVNERLRAFLIEHGLEPLVVTGMGLEAIAAVDNVTQNDLIEFGARVRASAPEADSLLVVVRRLQDARAPRAARSAHRRARHLEHAARLVGRCAARRHERRGAGLRKAAVARGVRRRAASRVLPVRRGIPR